MPRHRVRVTRPNESYDEATGQVFSETTVKVTSMVSTWNFQSTGKKQNPETYRRPGQGTSSLLDTALRSCVWNIDFFVPETFEQVEWPIAKVIYQHLKETDTLTSTSWMLFRAVYPEEVSPTYPVRIPEERGSAPVKIPSIISLLSKVSFASLTFLSIRNLLLCAGDLMSLLDIPQLAVLNLEQDYSALSSDRYTGIDDRFIRNWGRAVYEKKTFQKLTVLLLYNFDIEITDILRGLNAFPALSLVNIDDSRSRCWDFLPEEKEFIELGWRQLPAEMLWLTFTLLSKPSETCPTHPQDIWSRNITTSAKLPKLYGLAATFLKQPTLEDNGDSSISIDYGTSTAYPRGGESVWLVRTRLLQEDNTSIIGEKRTSEGRGSKDRADSKKRKVRGGKQKDIASLLGGFI